MRRSHSRTVGMLAIVVCNSVIAGGCGAPSTSSQPTSQSAVTEPPKAPSAPESTSELRGTLTHDGRTRGYMLQKPTGGEPRKYPVILLLHPAASTGQIVWGQTSLPRIARENRAILVAPDGVNQTWDTHYWKKGGVDDVGFLTRLLDVVIAEHGGDPERVYATGMSAGAGMCFALAFTIGDRLAAIGPVANNLGKEGLDHPIRLTKPLPVVHIMGTKDKSVPYAGGLVFGIWPVLSADETVAYWVKHNRCRPESTSELLPDVDPGDSSRVTRIHYSGGPDGADVVHFKVEGGGHTWPNGPKDDLGRRLFGETNRDIDSGTVLWEFFRDKRRPVR